MKIVINECHGGFGLSLSALELYNKYSEAENWHIYNISRTDPNLIKVVEELGDLANGLYSKLKIVEIPNGVEYKIEEYDGMEHIAEVHKIWK